MSNKKRTKHNIKITGCHCGCRHSGDALPTVVIRSKGKPGKILTVALWVFGFMTLLGFARLATGELDTVKDVQAFIVVSVLFVVLGVVFWRRRK